MGISLSEILAKLIQLESIDTKPLQDVEQFFMDIKTICKDVKFYNKAEMAIASTELRTSIDQYLKQIEVLKSKLENNIFQNHQEFIARSEEIYNERANKFTFDEYSAWIENHPIIPHDFDYFYAKIVNSCSWLQPALIFGANKSTISKAILAAEPVYFVERFKEYFDIQAEHFNPAFKKRMRFYSLDELDALPLNCFGTIVIYNQFPFLPWKEISRLIKIFVNCLAPGGMLIFNYNNCRTARGFYSFEQQLLTYTLPSMYLELAKELDLELKNSHDSLWNNFSLFEFQKSGSMDLIKRHPSMGMIKNHPLLGNGQALADHVSKIKNILNS